jgi:hypothetical protein
MGGRVECTMWADMGARTSIGASRDFTNTNVYCPTFMLFYRSHQWPGEKTRKLKVLLANIRDNINNFAFNIIVENDFEPILLVAGTSFL